MASRPGRGESPREEESFGSIFQGELFLTSRNWRIRGAAVSPGSTRDQWSRHHIQNVEQPGDVWECQNSEREYHAGQGEYVPARLVDKGFR